MYCHILQHDPRDLCVCCPCDWYGLITVLQQFCNLDLEKVSGSYILAPSCHSFRCSAKPIASLRKDKFHPNSDCPVMLLHGGIWGGLCSFSPVGSAARREKLLIPEKSNWREKSCRPHGSQIWAISVFLQKRHGKNMSLALSFNRALQKCFAQRVREAKYLRHWSSLIIHQVGCHSIDQVSRLIQGSFGGSIGQNAEVSVWNQGVYQH